MDNRVAVLGGSPRRRQVNEPKMITFLPEGSGDVTRTTMFASIRRRLSLFDKSFVLMTLTLTRETGFTGFPS